MSDAAPQAGGAPGKIAGNAFRIVKVASGL